MTARFFSWRAGYQEATPVYLGISIYVGNKIFKRYVILMCEVGESLPPTLKCRTHACVLAPAAQFRQTQAKLQCSGCGAFRR